MFIQMMKRLRQIFRLGWLYAKGSTLEYYYELKQWQKASPESLRQDRDERLRSLLQHAYRHVPYYADVLKESGVVTQKSVNLDRFRDLPLLDKETLQSQSERLRPDDLDGREWFYETSGGSTGEPVRFIQDADTVDWGRAVKMLFNEWTGYQFGMPRVRLWGSERDILENRESIKTTLGRWVRNETFLNAFRMSSEDMHSFVRTINEVQPAQILAYVESIYELAHFIREEDKDVYSPDAIMTSAGKLHDHMRDAIEDVFETQCFDRYGSREVGDIACECTAHDGLHVCAPTHYVELLRPDGRPAAPGEVGEVVVTLLTNYAMPLIRYRIGDMAVRSHEGGVCSCGCAWSKLTEIKGRVSDTFTTEEGTRVHGEYFTHLFYFRDWVRKFQVIQVEPDHIRVRIVPDDSFLEYALDEEERAPDEWQSDMADIREDIHKVMGDRCSVGFVFEDDIPPSKSGKYRYTISKVTGSN